MTIPATIPATITASAKIAAPPARVYAILADYRSGHPSILPPAAFLGLEVEAGGVGDGTRILVRARKPGGVREMRMRVTEPEPGRVLAEEDVETGTRTTFTVEPCGTGDHCRVTLTTVWAPGSVSGLERLLIPLVVPRVFREELRLLAAAARDGAPALRHA